MSRYLYHTDGLILASWPVGEADCRLDIFTARLGRIAARAPGVRELKSKLRYHLQILTLARLAFVRGAGGWRVVHAAPLFEFGRPWSDGKRAAAARLLSLLSRFVVAPGRLARVWREAASAYQFLLNEALSGETADFELLATWRLLVVLGYGQASPALAPFAGRPWERSLISDFSAVRQKAFLVVEQALYHSHL